MQSKSKDVESALDQELSRLCAVTGYGSNLRVKYDPKCHSSLEGEVQNDIICIYSGSREKAIETLRHEFLDWLIVQSLRPYEELVNVHKVALNAIFKHLQEQAYAKKERLVETLMRLLSTGSIEKEKST